MRLHCAINVFIILNSCTQVEEAKDISSRFSADSLYALGEFYLNEDTDQPQYDRAENYLSEAATFDYPKAFYALGYEYALGHKFKRDKEKGVDYLKKAAELGVIEARYTLAQFFYFQDDVENVIKHLVEGSSAGDGFATYQLYMLYHYGRAFGQIERTYSHLIDEKRGIDYLIQSAEMGVFEAQLSLAYSYRKGLNGVLEPDKEKALHYFELAQKNPEVQEIPGASDELEIAKKDLRF